MDPCNCLQACNMSSRWFVDSASGVVLTSLAKHHHPSIISFLPLSFPLDAKTMLTMLTEHWSAEHAEVHNTGTTGKCVAQRMMLAHPTPDPWIHPPFPLLLCPWFSHILYFRIRLSGDLAGIGTARLGTGTGSMWCTPSLRAPHAPHRHAYLTSHSALSTLMHHSRRSRPVPNSPLSRAIYPNLLISPPPSPSASTQTPFSVPFLHSSSAASSRTKSACTLLEGAERVRTRRHAERAPSCVFFCSALV